MSTSTVQSQNQVTTPTETHLLPMRWFVLIVLTLWTIGVLAAPIVIWCLTKNLYSLPSFFGYALPVFLWQRSSDYVFPMNERRFQLEMAKIRLVAEKQHNTKRVP